MYRHLGWRQRKQQPALAEIDRRKFQHGSKEGTIGFRVLAVEKKMRSRNHRGNILMSRELNSLKEALDSRRVKPLKKLQGLQGRVFCCNPPSLRYGAAADGTM
jgi:hypothetical protein